VHTQPNTTRLLQLIYSAIAVGILAFTVFSDVIVKTAHRVVDR